MLTHIDNAWTIEDDGGESKVTSVANFKLKWWALPMAPMLRMGMTKSIGDFVGQLASHVEAGSPAEALRATPELA